MDAKLAERMKRLRLQQEEAEEAEWSSSSRGGQSLTGLGGPSPRPSETSAPVAPEVPCMDEDEPGMHAVGLQMQEDSATERPPLAPADAHQVDEEDKGGQPDRDERGDEHDVRVYAEVRVEARRRNGIQKVELNEAEDVQKLVEWMRELNVQRP